MKVKINYSEKVIPSTDEYLPITPSFVFLNEKGAIKPWDLSDFRWKFAIKFEEGNALFFYDKAKKEFTAQLSEGRSFEHVSQLKKWVLESKEIQVIDIGESNSKDENYYDELHEKLALIDSIAFYEDDDTLIKEIQVNDYPTSEYYRLCVLYQQLYYKNMRLEEFANDTKEKIDKIEDIL